MLIGNEIATDIPAIRRVVTQAMQMLAQSTGTEAAIVDRLRADHALALSLVAKDGEDVVGYLAASMAQIGPQHDWGLIGPLAVLPSRQGQGIGSALMAEALLRLKSTCRGAVLVGSPRYYGRVGFRAFPGLKVAGCPPDVVQALPFDTAEPKGDVIHHAAFGLDQRG